LLKTGALQDAILNSANFSSIATDENGIIQIFNVGAERMLGYAAADVLNKITPADISDPQEVIARAKALSVELSTPITPGFEALVFKASRGIEDIYELTYIRKDGSRFPAVVSVTALRDAQNAIIGYLLIGTDNTARKRAEEAVALLGAIVDSSDDAIISKDLNGIITSWNKSAERLFGYKTKEVIGKSISILIPSDRPNEEPEILAKVRRGEHIDHFETVRVRKDHARVDISLTISPVKDAKGVIVGVSKIAGDITERKQGEVEKKHLDERLRDVTEQKRAAESKLIHEREAMQRKLISTVSHELCTPISVIKASAETLLMGTLKNAKARSNFLKIIDNQADHLTGLVKKILLIAELESGECKPVTSAIALADFLKASLSGISMLAEKKTISISIQVDPRLVLLADRSHLTSIFQNLLDNAIKYNKKNGSIEIKAHRNDNGEAQVSVRDTGIGISAAELPLIFQQFHRTARVRELGITGTGLCLYIVKTMVDSNGGRIWVESGKDEGTVFHFTLPSERE
jgi:PAS domain S-box-containing protein